MFLSPEGTLYKRKEHALKDVMSFIGGLGISVAFIINVLINRFQKFSFDMRAIKRLYLARTTDDKLFPKKINNSMDNYAETEEGFVHNDQELNAEIGTHRKIRFSNESWFSIFTGLNDNYRIQETYQEGANRLNEELDLVNIIKKLRQLDVIMENSLLSKDERKNLV